MKQYIITIILALCMASCSQHSKHWETLAQVESYIEERPDSTLNFLQGIDLKNDDYGQMLKYYAQGKVECNDEDYPASIISFFNAEKIAKKLNNYYILGLIYHSVSDTLILLFWPFVVNFSHDTAPKTKTAIIGTI